MSVKGAIDLEREKNRMNFVVFRIRISIIGVSCECVYARVCVHVCMCAKKTR